MSPSTTDHYFVSFDKIPIHYVLTPSEREIRANLLLIHGNGEYAERYNDFAGFLSKNGLTVYAMDLRGFGKSGGPRAYVKTFDHYAQDISSLANMIQMQDRRPFFLFGHSLGGLIASYAAAYAPLRPIHGLILSSPCFGLSKTINPLRKLFARSLEKIWPTSLHDTGMEPDILTHDRLVIEAYLRDARLCHKISSALYGNIEKEIAAAGHIASRLQCPVFIAQAGDDKVVDANATARFFASLTMNNRDLKVYHGLYHEIINELSRSDVYQDIMQWIDRHI